MHYGLAHRPRSRQLFRMGGAERPFREKLELAAVEEQIGVLEFGDRLEAPAVEDRQLAVLALDQSPPPKLLESPVGVHDGKSEALRNLALRQWKFVRISLGAPDRVEPRVKLAEQMRHPRDR